ncbi:hypothetical protein [Pedococcus bigeumensis]|uniref:DUF4386 family protein n=1 Tax=Pedococcus bigeumensis TaxID=433644 RepID=A0A502CYI7_9MICO|nr:hypothetical protein [Pedococcus bigeumensis]TPG16811.1 hypothetical protein EAH86_08375 [Pedococcus bigeumensis]
MNQPSTYRRNIAAAGLIATAVLSAVSVALQPALTGDGAQRLSALRDAAPSAAISAATFVLAQLPLIVGVLGIGHLLRSRAPKLSASGATLAVLGAFGHAVIGGVMLLQVAMATDSDAGRRTAYAALVDQMGNTPVMLFSLAGLAGTVVGLLLLAVGLWRSQVVARWVPATLIAFLVVEFAGGAVSDAASYLSSVCLLAAFGGTAIAILRSPAHSWSTPANLPAPSQPAVADSLRQGQQA